MNCNLSRINHISKLAGENLELPARDNECFVVKSKCQINMNLELINQRYIPHALENLDSLLNV